MSPASVQFGLFVPQGWRLDLTGIDVADQWRVMRDVARLADAEGSGFTSVWVYDHFHTVPSPTAEATHEAWTLMAALAAATTRVRLGQMCTCMGYRNPAYLAKVAATIDVISGGRLEMGIGGGWYEHEWRAYGYGFPSAGERLGMLDEGVQIMRDLWAKGEATLHGKHYDVDGAICRPLPLQDGGPPLWIAGGGERKTLRTAAAYAAATNFAGDLKGFEHKSRVLADHCRDLGTDFDAITRSANYNVVVGESAGEVEDRLTWIRDHYAPHVSAAKVDETVESFRTGPLVGTPGQIVDTLRELRAAGMTYALTYFAEAAYDTAAIELFQREVIPALS
jgi:F420-dependent oxidoreductase-like protein